MSIFMECIVGGGVVWLGSIERWRTGVTQEALMEND